MIEQLSKSQVRPGQWKRAVDLGRKERRQVRREVRYSRANRTDEGWTTRLAARAGRDEGRAESMQETAARINADLRRTETRAALLARQNSGLRNIKWDVHLNEEVRDSIRRNFPKGARRPVVFHNAELAGMPSIRPGRPITGSEARFAYGKDRNAHVWISTRDNVDLDATVIHEMAHAQGRRTFGRQLGLSTSQKKRGQEEARADVEMLRRRPNAKSDSLFNYEPNAAARAERRHGNPRVALPLPGNRKFIGGYTAGREQLGSPIRGLDDVGLVGEKFARQVRIGRQVRNYGVPTAVVGAAGGGTVEVKRRQKVANQQKFGSNAISGRKQVRKSEPVGKGFLKPKIAKPVQAVKPHGYDDFYDEPTQPKLNRKQRQSRDANRAALKYRGQAQARKPVGDDFYDGFGKAYDPHDEYQRRLGGIAAGSAVGGAVLGASGIKGIRQAGKASRKGLQALKDLEGMTIKRVKSTRKDKNGHTRNEYADFHGIPESGDIDPKAMIIRRKDAAKLAGGAGLLYTGGATSRHARSERNQRWS